MDSTAQLIVAAFLVFYHLLVFGASMLSPQHAMALLVPSTRSRAVFYVQILVRIMVGMAFVTLAPRLFLSPVFTIFGWGFALVSAIPAFMPWHRHLRSAERAISQLTPIVRYIGVASLILGVAVGATLWRAGAV
jgi:hypothetical protein